MESTECPDCESVMLALERFKSFLVSAWPVITEVLGDHDWDCDAYFLEDWLDLNWKLLVCRQLLGKEGELQPFAVATKEIEKKRYNHRLESIEGRKIFVSLGTGDRAFEIAPPFDKVKVLNQNGVSEVLPWSSLRFELKSIS